VERFRHRHLVAFGEANLMQEPLLKPNNDMLVDTTGEQFELDCVIGEGTSGVVYKARQASLDRTVAIKILKISGASRAIQRLRNEAVALAQLQHPSIVRIHRLGLSTKQQPFLVLDFVQGTTLAGYLSEGKTLSIAQIQLLFGEILDGLTVAHNAGFVHGDIKPSNIMLTDDGHAKLMDFGLVKDADQEPSASNRLAGTPAYMSPEQWMGKAADRRSDLYSLVCVMFEALVGKALHKGESAFEIGHNLLAKSLCLGDVQLNESCTKLIRKGLDREPGKRYQTAAELANALRQIDENEPILPERKRSRWTALALFGALAILAGSLCLVGISRLLTPNREMTGSGSLEVKPLNTDRLKQSVYDATNYTLKYMCKSPKNQKTYAIHTSQALEKLLEDFPRSTDTTVVADGWEAIAKLRCSYDRSAAAQALENELRYPWYIHGKRDTQRIRPRIRLAHDYAILHQWPRANSCFSRLITELKAEPELRKIKVAEVYEAWAQSALVNGKWQEAIKLADDAAKSLKDEVGFSHIGGLPIMRARLEAFKNLPNKRKLILSESADADAVFNNTYVAYRRGVASHLVRIRAIRMEVLQDDGTREQVKAEHDLMIAEAADDPGLLRQIAAYYGRLLLKNGQVEPACEQALVAAQEAVRDESWTENDVSQLRQELESLRLLKSPVAMRSRFDQLTEDLVSPGAFL
jgi:serine/threonine protein kinase